MDPFSISRFRCPHFGGTMTNHTREETFRLTSFARCAG
jgi:hypothetical protein